MSESRFAVIGDRNTVLAFMVLGAKIYTPEPEKVREAVLKAVKDDVVILFITEKMAQSIPDVLKELSKKTFPSVVVIPDAGGSRGMGLEKLNDIIVRAVGSRLASPEE